MGGAVGGCIRGVWGLPGLCAQWSGVYMHSGTINCRSFAVSNPRKSSLLEFKEIESRLYPGGSVRTLQNI